MILAPVHAPGQGGGRPALGTTPAACPVRLGQIGWAAGVALPHPLPLTALGYAAASITSLSFFPQALKTLRCGDTRALSLPMCLLRTSALAIWLLYGVCSHNGPITLANGLALLPMGLVLERKWREHQREASRPVPEA